MINQFLKLNNVFEIEQFKMDKLLWDISASGDITKFETLKEAKFNLNIHNLASFSPLQNACFNGYAYCVRLFLENGADPNRVDSFEETPLWLACHYGHTECVKILLQFGARIDLGLSPINEARDNGYIDIVTILENSIHDKATNSSMKCLYGDFSDR